jgi:hypothetical protein
MPLSETRRPTVTSARRFSFGAPTKPAVTARTQLNTGTTLTVTYNRRASWMGLIILVFLYFISKGVFSGPDQNGMQLSGFEHKLFIGVFCLAFFVAVMWFIQGLRGTTALSITRAGVSGFTVFGTKEIAWSDIHSLEIVHHNMHGNFLILHGKTATWIGRKLWLNSITIGLKQIDRSLEEIVAAMQSWRPDIQPPV